LLGAAAGRKELCPTERQRGKRSECENVQLRLQKKQEKNDVDIKFPGSILRGKVEKLQSNNQEAVSYSSLSKRAHPKERGVFVISNGCVLRGNAKKGGLTIRRRFRTVFCQNGHTQKKEAFSLFPMVVVG